MFAIKMSEVQNHGHISLLASSTGQPRQRTPRRGRPSVWCGLVAAPLVLLLVALSYIEGASLAGEPELLAAAAAAGHQREHGQARPTMMRFRRQAPLAHSTANKLQQLELDEQAMKRQLPELIAQAHQDKSVERALLRMLINASLRSNLEPTSELTSQRQSWPVSGDLSASLMDSESSVLTPARRPEFFGSAGESNAVLSEAELGSLMATIDQLNAGQLQPIDQSLMGSGQQSYPMMDKREYIKPCSFNAISCVRTPFRKL